MTILSTKESFKAKELYDYMHSRFPDSFSIEIFKNTPHPNNNLHFIYEDRIFNIWHTKLPGNDFYLNDSYDILIRSGQENTYVYFLITDKENDYVVSWGYKRCDVLRNYLQELLIEITSTIDNR